MKLECLSKPAKTDKRGSILFVHDICHGAWCWQHYQDYFSENGYDTYAMSLRGHGQSDGHAQINEWGLDHYCDDVINIISSLEATPIIVGHSMGGAIVERLLVRDPSLVKAAVFLAPARFGGCTKAWGLKVTAKNPLKALELQNFIEGKTVSARQVQKSLFFDGRISRTEAEAMKDLFCAESEIAAKDLEKPYTVDASKLSTPIYVIGSQADLLFGKTDLTETAQHLGAELHVMDELCHDMQLDIAWEKSAENILQKVLSWEALV